MTRLLLLIVGLLQAAPTRALTQDPGPASLELGLGLALVDAPDHYRAANLAFTAHALATLRPGDRSGGGLLGALEVSAVSPGGHTDVCDILPGGECAPTLPVFTTVSPLLAWEGRGGGLRVAAGPAAAWGDDGCCSARFAAVTRADVFSGPRGPFSLSGFARALLVPSYDGGAFGFVALGIGLRFR